MTEIVVTTHALIRYMERGGATDADVARQELIELARPGVERGYHTYEVDDFRIRLDRNVVVTVIRRDEARP